MGSRADMRMLHDESAWLIDPEDSAIAALGTEYQPMIDVKTPFVAVEGTSPDRGHQFHGFYRDVASLRHTFHTVGPSRIGTFRPNAA